MIPLNKDTRKTQVTTRKIWNMVLAAAMAAVFTTAAPAQQEAAEASDTQIASNNPISGSCAVAVTIGNSNSPEANCVFTNGVGNPNKVPANKNMVIEDISGRCYKNANDPLDVLLFSTPYSTKEVPLTVLTSTVNGVQRIAGSLPMRAYVPSNMGVRARVYFRQPVTTVTNCSIQFTGHLVKK